MTIKALIEKLKKIESEHGEFCQVVGSNGYEIIDIEVHTDEQDSKLKYVMLY